LIRKAHFGLKRGMFGSGLGRTNGAEDGKHVSRFEWFTGTRARYRFVEGRSFPMMGSKKTTNVACRSEIGSRRSTVLPWMVAE
jgi:hypothetical protein